jgi:trk system potassium uptake protein TrkA
LADFAVIGMGRFGAALARHLVSSGQGVLVIDRDPRRLDKVSGEVEATACIDATAEHALEALELVRVGSVVVTIGSRATEASVLVTAILRELGVPRIVARAFDSRHARLLRALGAHEILNPEEEMAHQLAVRLAYPGVLAEIPFAGATIAEVELPEAFVGRNLRDLDLRRRFGVTVLAIRRDGTLQVNPGAEDTTRGGDTLTLLGNAEMVRRLAQLL